MGLGDWIAARFGHNRTNVSFMSFKGDCNSPGFTINLDDMHGLREAYCKCSPVSTIINRLASSMANGKWWIVDKNNNCVSDSTKYRSIAELLKRPNPLQTWTEFINQLDIYRPLYGITYVYANVSIGMLSPADASSLWAINPERIKPVFKTNVIYFANKVEDIIEKYVITVGNTTIDVDPKHILVIRDSFGAIQSFDKPHSLSRIKGLKNEVRNIIQAQEAIYSLNKDRGAQGIITNKTKDASGSMPLTPDEKKQIQDQYKKQFGLSENQAKIIITDSDLGWQQLTFSVKDLMLFEGIKQNIESVSDALNYPFELLANQKGTTFENRAEAIKYLYQDNIIPTSNLYEEKFSEFFGLDEVKIEIDFSDVEYLKEAEKEKAEAYFKKNQGLQIAYKLGVITKEEYRIELDMDEKPKGNTFYTVSNEGSKNISQT